MRYAVPVAFLCLCASFAAADEKPAANGFPIKAGDRVMFLGDSITEQYQYSSLIELYLTTRMPGAKIVCLNAGISGDTATGGAGRFKTHVLDEKPTIVTINFGMNDGGYGGFNKGSAANYVKNTEKMLAAAKAAGVRVALISPNAVEVKARPGLKTYLETQKEFYAPLKGLAEKNGLPFADQYAVTRKVLEKISADEAKVSPFPDGVHTNMTGGLLMAHSILTGLGAPALVSEVVIDGAKGTAVGKGATVSDVSVKDGVVSFKRLDEALPLPVTAEMKGLLPYVNDLADLNTYTLKATALQAPSYALTIDGVAAGTFSAADLAKGVNLGNLGKGPIHDQGAKVFQAINAKNQLVHRRFRDVVMFNAPPWLADVVAERKPAELKSRMDKIEAAQAAIWELAKPKERTFVLTPAK